jgi:hypothetical protein
MYFLTPERKMVRCYLKMAKVTTYDIIFNSSFIITVPLDTPGLSF